MRPPEARRSSCREGNGWLWKSGRKKFVQAAFRRSSWHVANRQNSEIERIPPSPLSWGSLDWCGLRKNGAQNLEPQRFVGQNLRNKEVKRICPNLQHTASALTIFHGIRSAGKVSRHMEPVDKFVAHDILCRLEAQIPTPTRIGASLSGRPAIHRHSRTSPVCGGTNSLWRNLR